MICCPLTVFAPLCHHIWGLCLLNAGYLVPTLHQRVGIATIRDLWETRVGVVSLQYTYTGEKATVVGVGQKSLSSSF
ncbi:hypothetical protein DPMN_073267 [Dreissena polymorpha]|uniref:Uncharacterized protein n=1 Tax=Dreissena polymorpha TaxID=45954 RepID=A0A9D4HAQ9_DREPO|nr:hypothetical protein DPMN_073267 [Dreissena polymorpha]